MLRIRLWIISSDRAHVYEENGQFLMNVMNILLILESFWGPETWIDEESVLIWQTPSSQPYLNAHIHISLLVRQKGLMCFVEEGKCGQITFLLMYCYPHFYVDE